MMYRTLLFYDAGKWQVGENGKVYVHVQRGNETLHLVVMNNEHIAGGTSVYEVINQYRHSRQMRWMTSGTEDLM